MGIDDLKLIPGAPIQILNMTRANLDYVGTILGVIVCQSMFE